MRVEYLAKRLGLFVLILWLASTVNFILPRLGGQDPIRAQLGAQAAMGGASQVGMKDMIAEYDKRFGLDKPLIEQYFTYLSDTLHFEFNFSLWQNADYDAIVDDTYRTSPTETQHMVDNWVKAMNLWLPQLPDIMIEQGYHRLPTNETYWTGWPNAQNPYVNSAFFHLTPGLIVHNLQPASA